MSRRTEKVERTYTDNAEVAVTCDLCGTTVEKRQHREGADWSTGTYEVLETAVWLKQGESYPEGGQHDVREYDICPECFRDRLEPWLMEQGAVPRERSLDF